MYCSTCGKEIENSALVCLGCGCPTNNYHGQMGNPNNNSGYMTQSDYNSAIQLKRYIDDVETAYMMGILSLIFFAGIGFIFIIIGRSKINGLPTIYSIPNDPISTAQYESAKRKLKSASNMLGLAGLLLFLAIVIGGVCGVVLAASGF